MRGPQAAGGPAQKGSAQPQDSLAGESQLGGRPLGTELGPTTDPLLGKSFNLSVPQVPQKSGAACCLPHQAMRLQQSVHRVLCKIANLMQMSAITFLMEGVEVFILENSKPSPAPGSCWKEGESCSHPAAEHGRGPLRPSAFWLLSEQERDLGQTGHALAGFLVCTVADAVIITKGSDVISGTQNRAEEKGKPATSSSCLGVAHSHLSRKEAQWLLKEKSGK